MISLARGLIQAGAGVAVGLVIAWFVGRLLESWLFGISATDPMSIASSAALLLATAGVAAWLPARRASRTDPLETLKAE